MSYRTEFQMVGFKPVSEFAPATPASQHVYGTVELPALEPAYVDLGRRRPKDGPMVEALDLFISEKIRALAKEINERTKKDLDDQTLDEVQKENEKLDRFKNKFLPTDHGAGGVNGDGTGNGDKPRKRDPVDWGEIPEIIELTVPDNGLRVALGVNLHVKQILGMQILDPEGKPVNIRTTWETSDKNIVRFSKGDLLVTRNKGRAEIWGSVKVGRNQTIESVRVPVEVLVVDHVLLTPRKLSVSLGKRAPIVAEVTDDEGRRSIDVLLEWKHDADDQFIVRIGPKGIVTGNRIGRTSITAGTSGIKGAELWANIPVEVDVIQSPGEGEQGGGFPRLLVTGRDLDPATGVVRDGDPGSPALWQEASDYIQNVWWLNLQSKEAFFAFDQRESNPVLWRNFHSLIVVEMVVQVRMQEEYSRKGDKETPNYRRYVAERQWHIFKEYCDNGISARPWPASF